MKNEYKHIKTTVSLINSILCSVPDIAGRYSIS